MDNWIVNLLSHSVDGWQPTVVILVDPRINCDSWNYCHFKLHLVEALRSADVSCVTPGTNCDSQSWRNIGQAKWMAEELSGEGATPGTSRLSSSDLSSNGDAEPHLPQPAWAIPDKWVYNFFTEQEVKLSSICNNHKKYQLHHTAVEVLDLDKLEKLGKEVKDLIYCFYKPAFNLQYLPMKQIFSEEQANHLALIWTPQFKQYLPWWRLCSVNEER